MRLNEYGVRWRFMATSRTFGVSELWYNALRNVGIAFTVNGTTVAYVEGRYMILVSSNDSYDYKITVLNAAIGKCKITAFSDENKSKYLAALEKEKLKIMGEKQC